MSLQWIESAYAMTLQMSSFLAILSGIGCNIFIMSMKLKIITLKVGWQRRSCAQQHMRCYSRHKPRM